MKRFFQIFWALLLGVVCTIAASGPGNGPFLQAGSGSSGGAATNAVSSITGPNITTTYTTNAGAISATVNLAFNVNGLTNGKVVYVLNTNYTVSAGYYAVGFTNTALWGLYLPFPTTVDGLVTYSNITLANGWLIQSNRGTGGQNLNKWQFTNSVLNSTASFSPKVNGSGYPTNGPEWCTSATGGNSGKVIPLATNTLTPTSFISTQTNNSARIETAGNDSIGIPGGYPFATHDGAVAFLLANGLSTNNPVVYWGTGSWASSTHSYPMFPGETWIGNGMDNTIIGVGPSLNISFNAANLLTNLCVQMTGSNAISGLTISNVLSGVPYLDQPILSGFRLEYCRVANTNNDDDSVLFNFTANTKGGATNFYAKDCIFSTRQDTLAGVNGFTADNCTFIGNNGQAPGNNVRDINSSDNRCVYTINGGQAYLYNGLGTTTSAPIFASQAGIINVYGLQTTVYPLNGTNIAVNNPGGATISGYMFFDGAYQYLGGFTNPPTIGFNGPTNIAPLTVVSNFTPNAGTVYTNLSGGRIFVLGDATFLGTTAGNQPTLTINITNGVSTQALLISETAQVTQANYLAILPYNFIVQAGGTFQLATSGTGSISFPSSSLSEWNF